LPSRAFTTLASVVAAAAIAAITLHSPVLAVKSATPHSAALSSLGWHVVATPHDKYDWLHGVSCATANDCVGVGENVAHATIAGYWNGQSWQPQATPNQTDPVIDSSRLYRVSCVTSGTCVAVGGSLYGVLADRWDGTQWTSLTPANPFPGSRQLEPYGLGVSCLRSGQCLAVGASEGLYYGYNFSEWWNGKGWHRLSSPKVSNGVACITPNYCLAVGDVPGPHGERASVQRWDGHRWRPALALGPTDTYFSDISCVPSGRCAAVGGTPQGGKDFLFAVWNGRTWHVRRIATRSFDDLTGVSCATASACEAVGSAGSRPVAYRWNGSTWRAQSLPNPGSGEIEAVSCSSASACMAVGQDRYGVLVERFGTP